MSAFSDYSEANILNYITGRAAMPARTDAFLALFSTIPTDTGGTELTGGAYARVNVTAAFGSAPVGDTISNSATISFPTASSAWATIKGYGLYDASTGGNLLWRGATSTDITVNSGQTYQIGAGSLQLTVQ